MTDGPKHATTGTAGGSPRRRLHVGVNLLWLVPGVVGGSEEYTVRLLLALAAARHDDPGDRPDGPADRPDGLADLDLTLFATRAFAEAHPEVVEHHPLVAPGRDLEGRPQRVAVESTWLPLEARRRGIDLLHHAGGIVPPGPAVGRIPATVTIHDLQPLLMPENFAPVKRRWLGAMLPRSARRARLVLTPSDPASASVVEHLGIPADRVATVPHGIEPPPAVPHERLEAVRHRYRLGERVVLYPAITYPHKDHRTLVEAFARVAADRPDVTLVLAGGPGPSEVEVVGAIRASGVGDRVRRTGRVPWEDLDALYALATAVAVPTRFEGFGAPALEAMAHGAPLVASDAAAVPWVVGDGGLLVPPGDVGAWADALARVLDDPAERDRLRAAGRRRAATFTWERSAAALLDGYRRAASMGEDGTA